jgi:hypothetical protein
MSTTKNLKRKPPRAAARVHRESGLAQTLMDRPEAMPPAGILRWPRISFWAGVGLVLVALARLAVKLLRR